MVYNISLKEFANGSAQIKKFSSPIYREETLFNAGEVSAERSMRRWKNFVEVPSEVVELFGVKKHMRDMEVAYDEEAAAERSLKSSLSRTISNLSDLVRNNTWEYFFTFTLDNEKVNRYDFSTSSKAVRVFLNNFKNRHNPELEYIVVPELHADGAVHFHGLFKNLNKEKLMPALDPRETLENGKENRYYNQQIKKNGKLVYNLNYYNLGYTTVTEIQDLNKTCSYILKYITKELCAATKNKRRYYYTQGLTKPVRHCFYLDKEDYRLFKRYLNNICDKKITYEKTISISVGSFQGDVFITEFDSNDLLDDCLAWIHCNCGSEWGCG